jgi:hypothetical protein
MFKKYLLNIRIEKRFGAGDMAQEVECLLSKCKTQGSIPSRAKTKQNKRKKPQHPHPPKKM